MHARSWTLPLDAWTDAWTEGDWPEDALVLAEAADAVALAYRADVPSDAAWAAGDCFTEGWHVTWRRLGERVRVVACGPAPLPEARWGEPHATLDLSGAEAEARQVVLWGRRNPGEELWIELRIPNLMTPPRQHPQGHDDHVAEDYVRRTLHVTTYRDPATRALLVHRYTGLGYASTDSQGRDLTLAAE